MNTYADRAANPFRMRTCKIKTHNPRRMNTYTKHGGGVGLIMLHASQNGTRTQPDVMARMGTLELILDREKVHSAAIPNRFVSRTGAIRFA